MKVERFVVDTNVLISAALGGGSVPAAWLNHVLRLGRLVFSDATFAELQTRLWRPKFDRYVTTEDRKMLLRDLQATAEWVADEAASAGPPCRDPDDVKFIAAALTSRAAALVSGDQDLLVLKQVGDVPVLTPAQALKRWAVVD
jgi:putative PIN family toxin of toxin-antitoxin system